MSDHQSSPSIGKRIGEFLILGLYLAIDVVEIWHRSHFWTLVVAFVGIVALLLLDGGFSRKQTISSAAVAMIACILIYFVVPEDLVQDVEVMGTLQPGGDPDPPNGCPRTAAINAWKIMIGTSAIQFAEPVDFPLLKIGSCPVLRITRDWNGVSVTADLFDSTGHLIASIKNNEFHALSGEHTRIERDHDLSKLIVLTGGGTEILYVHYLNRSTVRIRGIFGCPRHTLVPVKDNEPIPGVRMAPGVCANVLAGVRFTEAFFGIP